MANCKKHGYYDVSDFKDCPSCIKNPQGELEAQRRFLADYFEAGAKGIGKTYHRSDDGSKYRKPANPAQNEPAPTDCLKMPCTHRQGKISICYGCFLELKEEIEAAKEQGRREAKPARSEEFLKFLEKQVFWGIYHWESVKEKYNELHSEQPKQQARRQGKK